MTNQRDVHDPTYKTMDEIFEIAERDRAIISENSKIAKYILPIITGRYYFNGRILPYYDDFCSQVLNKKKRLGA